MSKPYTQPRVTKKSVQGMENLSFDDEFDVLVAEALGQEGTNLRRIQVDANGLLKVTI